MAAAEKTIKKQLTGTVVSDKMDKTRVVVVENIKKHSMYDKYVSTRSRFMVHDENNQSKAGNQVIIEESIPLSSKKRWNLVKILDAKK